jgi:phosphate transport system substrate-binding protein
MTDQQLANSKLGPILHIPVVMGAGVVAYNIPGVSAELKFTPHVLADIFLGKISKWNDPRIVSANTGIKLPDTPIIVAHRSDGSGTTYIWTDYLSKVSPEWKAKVGTGTSVSWPVGLGAKGNEGVAGLVRQTPGAIGYIELIYAVQNNIPFGSMQNSTGHFVKPSMESVTAAAASAQIPDDFRYSITNAPGKDAYPISGTVWLLIPVHPRDAARGKAVVEFTNWILGEGQGLAPNLHYARIPDEIASRARKALQQVK